MCHLLNKLPDCVALHEPMRPNQLAGLTMDEILGYVRDFFEAERQRIRSHGRATSKASGGSVPANPLLDKEVAGKRRANLDGREIHVSNVSGADFVMYIKHPGFFTACLPSLVREMECFASVRNPLSVILSWRNAGMPVTHGRAPAAERFDHTLMRALDGEPDILKRQFILLDYFFRRFGDHLPTRVLKYEDLVATNGRALALVHPAAAALDEPLSSRNARAIGGDSEAMKIAEALVASDNACWSFYRRDDVENLFR